MTQYATRLTNDTDTAPRMRAADNLGLAPDGPLLAKSGVRPDGGGVVAVVSGAMSVTVSPLMAWIKGSSTGQVGVVYVSNAVETLPIAAGHASLARVDTVAVRLFEDAFDTSGQTLAQLVVIQGSPGSGTPNVPATCIPLRDVVVPAGASAGSGGLASSALSTDRRRYLTSLGAFTPVASQAERDALTAPGNVPLFVWRMDTGALEVRRAGQTTWTLLLGGSLTQAVANLSAQTGVTITYEVRSGIVFVTVGSGSGTSIPTGTSAIWASLLPAAYRPSSAQWTGAALNGQSGFVRVDTDGTVSAINPTGATRTSIAATVVYPLKLS